MKHFVTTFPLHSSPSSSTQSDDAFSFSVAVDEAGSVVATAFGDRARLAQRGRLGTLIEDDRHTASAREQVEAFFAGELRTFSLPLAPQGSVYQQRVWQALQRIPFGETRSYGQLADELGSAPRAVGRANATNPICLIIPCHRVIGADGSLTGFAFGEEVKRRLLQLERNQSAHGWRAEIVGPAQVPGNK